MSIRAFRVASSTRWIGWLCRREGRVLGLLVLGTFTRSGSSLWVTLDGLCYADGDGVPEFTQSYADGNLCQICDVTQSQTSWSEDLTIVGVSECFIDGVCYKGNYSGVDAEFLSYVSDEDATPVTSICQYCDQTKDKNAWSVVEGYAVSPGENPPNDCQFTATRGVNTGESDGTSTLGSGGQGLFALALTSLAAILLQWPLSSAAARPRPAIDVRL